MMLTVLTEMGGRGWCLGRLQLFWENSGNSAWMQPLSCSLFKRAGAMEGCDAFSSVLRTLCTLPLYFVLSAIPHWTIGLGLVPS